MRTRIYLKFLSVKAVVKENAHKSLTNFKISSFWSKNHATKNPFLRPNGVENVSNMSQSVWNIIIDDQKHILELSMSHKGRFKKAPQPAPMKK